MFTPFFIKSWFGAKVPIPAGFHVQQAVVPVILVKLCLVYRKNQRKLIEERLVIKPIMF